MQQPFDALWGISKLIDKDLKTICDNVLSEIVEMTKSPYGFYGFMNKSEDVMTIFSWSKEAMDNCRIEDAPIQYPIDNSGIWGNAVRARKPFVLNDYVQDCENKRGVPKGHVALTRLLSVPVINFGKVVAVGAVANKKESYSEDDITMLSVFLRNVQVLIDRKNLETSLKESTDHFRELYRRTPAMMHSIDKDEVIVNVSNQWLEKMGYGRDEVLGQKFTLFLTDESSAYAKEVILPKFFKIGEVHDIPYNFLTKDGKVMQTLLSASAEYDDDGCFLRSLAVVNDVTEKNMLMQEQARSSQLEALGTVAAGVAHEVNNPINGIINYAVLLSKHANDKDKVLDIASRISKESDRIAKITSDLLCYSKDNRAEKNYVDIVDVIESALSLIAPKSRATNILVKTEFNKTLPEIFVNPQSIQQVIINLVDNAYDALRHKKLCSVEPVIHVSCLLTNDEPQMCCIEVSDNGIGMSDEVLKKAKDTFFTTKPSSEGTGLGLSIVYDLVKRHNGFLNIESLEGEFTKVRVLLPLSLNDS